MTNEASVDTNEFGQPIGRNLQGWSTAGHPGGVVLEGRTVRLEPLSPAHAEGLHAAFTSAPPGHWTYMPWGPFESQDAFVDWVDAAVRTGAAEYLAICAPDGDPLGVAGYLAIEPAMGSVEVGGITFAPMLQGTTEATEAMYLMMAHAFDDLGYRRYEWKCDALNGPSRAAAERLGFVYEGTFAQHRVVRGRNRDTAWFGLTDRRWRAEVKPALLAWLAPKNFDATGRQRERLEDLRGTGTGTETSEI